MRPPLPPRPAISVLLALLAAGATAGTVGADPPAAAGNDPLEVGQEAESCSPAAAPAERKQGRFRDPEDGALDLSEHLLHHRGFLPVPIVITEPAVDYGGGLALVFFRESIAERQAASGAAGGRMAPPDVGAVAAFKTANGTWGAGGGYFGTLAGDRFRYTVVAALAELNLDFYGALDLPRRFSLEAPLVRLDGQFRLGGSDWFLGARYAYFGASARFVRETPAEIAPRELTADLGRLSLLVGFDSRDNVLTASRGAFAELDLGWARPELGSSTSFESQRLKGFGYLPLGERSIVGVRGEAAFTDGDVPFYARPFLFMRGIPAMRFQGEETVLAETEVRVPFARRWALVGFLGAGRAFGGRVSFSDAETVWGGGGGFRYLLARRLGLWGGVDLARGSGTDDATIYLQVGSAWR